ncbi:hypothetical protein JXO59_11585 [candidate division KSB1 bacterium]|nr:hypothetical protein [candidate division KSB1 bacterium]
MMQQHQAYVATLMRLGLTVEVLEPLPDYPDAYFVEDTAVVMPEVAVIANPGAAARNGEQEAMAPALARHRRLEFIRPPGTLDGGDVLMADRHFFIGLSGRTNRSGAEQFADIAAKFGYQCTLVPVPVSLHLKADVSYMGDGTLLVTTEMAMAEAFEPYTKIILHPSEAYAANALLINDHILLPKGFADCRGKLLHLGKQIIELDVGEAGKMDGGLSCLSLRF